MLRVAALNVAALTVAVLIVPAVPATAAGDPPAPCTSQCTEPGPEPGAGGSAGGGSISVTVRGSGVSAGGEEFEVPASTLGVDPVCWYGFVATGAEYASWWDEGRYDELMRNLPDEDHFEPYAGYEDHRDDEDGGWWSPRCSSANWPGDFNDGYGDFAVEYFETHDAMFVEAGDVPPAADVPPDVLAQIAFESMDLPVGTVRWNPTRTGDGATFVGMDTWVWVEGAATSVEVTASVSTGTWARVDAGLAELVVTAPGAQSASCSDAGVAWSEDADPAAACAVVFDRSSANQPVKTGHDVPTSTMTATARWTASWVSSLDPTPTELPTQEVVTTAEIPVAEVQTLVGVSR